MFNPVLNDVVEVGAVNYIYQRTEWMRSRLQKYFPDLWEHIYAASVIRAIYDCRFRRLQLHYEDSILSYLYPGLSFMPNAVTEFLNTLGRMRGAIRSYMQEMVAEHERFLLFDGHRLLSASNTVDNAEYGYDSKMRYKPQINLLYMFTLGGDIGYPVYYKQYLGSTLDVSAFSDMLTSFGMVRLCIPRPLKLKASSYPNGEAGTWPFTKRFPRLMQIKRKWAQSH